MDVDDNVAEIRSGPLGDFRPYEGLNRRESCLGVQSFRN